MAVQDPEQTLRRATAFAANPTIRYLRAEAHARAILRNVTEPSPEWPHFRDDLDERLHHAGHSLLWSGLQLLEAGVRGDEVKQLLLVGAESLEYLSTNPRYGSVCRIEQAVNATFGYYLAGHYARSYVLLKEAIPEATSLPPALGLLVAVLRKQLVASRTLSIQYLSDWSFSDDAVARALGDGRISEDEAYQRILLRAASQAVSYFLEFPKNGERSLLDEAIRVLDDAILIARENRFVDWWWWLFCLRYLFQEFGEASLWTQLPPFRDSEEGSALVDEYIRAGLRQDPPVMELWPSQQRAVSMITDPSRPDFCLKMPTSCGKTRIAELAILRFLLDHRLDPTAKCLYLAPFRSLAVEVEQSLRRSFGGLGVLVSQIYGGFEITPDDLISLRKYRILIATPEKLDSLLRCVPELTQEIRLVIIDEGHIVDATERGLRFEFFVHRIRRLLPRSQCRFVFISAVLPNAAEFAEWIAGSPENVVESSWRPSRLMLGTLSWDGTRARIDYTYEGRQRFGQECYVPHFIEQKPCRGVPGVGQRRNPFPHAAPEAFALAALLFARAGTTLVFVPQQRSVVPFGETLLDVLRLQQCLKQTGEEAFTIPTPGRGSPLWERCEAMIRSEMGSDSILLTLLDAGIVVHHGELPWRVRVAIEELARADGVRLLVATTTLAQGVNLPIKTVLVRGLMHGHGEPVSSGTFWNICGRAGRAMRESEGQVLFCIDRTSSFGQQRRLERVIRDVLDPLEAAKVSSALLQFLHGIATQWHEAHPTVGLSELCAHLAENRYDWGTPEQQEHLRFWLDRLDGHLLSFSEEFGIGPDDLDRLQELLEGSLLFIQLRQQDVGALSADAARDLLHARIRYIHAVYPDGQVRQRMYRLGMSLSSCARIEQERPQLLTLFREAEAWPELTRAARADLLFRLSAFIFQLPDTQPTKSVPDEWPVIFAAWMAGSTTADMAQIETIARFSSSPSVLGVLIEDLCGYRLPWGLNSIFNYLSALLRESGESLAPVCSFFSGMVKYGLDDPVAVCLVPYLDLDRQLALHAARVCPLDFDRPERIIRWLFRMTPESLERAGLSAEMAMAIISKRDQRGKSEIGRAEIRPSVDVRILVSREAFEQVDIGQKILVVPTGEREETEFQALTLDGQSLGTFSYPDGRFPTWWRTVHLIDAEVVFKLSTTDGLILHLQIMRI